VKNGNHWNLVDTSRLTGCTLFGNAWTANDPGEIDSRSGNGVR